MPTLQNPLDETINRAPSCEYTYRKDHIRAIKILQSMSEFGGLWQQQDNPARTERNDSNGRLCGRWSLTEEEEVGVIYDS